MSAPRVHPSSLVSPEASLGADTVVWQHCTVLSGARIGAHCMLSQNVYVEGGVVVGNHVKVKNNVCLYAGVTLEDDVFVGPCAVFTNVRTPRSRWPRKDEFSPTLVRRGATIGANATLVCGVTVGRHALVGAGSVVTRDVPDHALVVGNPARQRGWVCICGEVLAPGSGERSCARCGSGFAVGPGGLTALNLAEPEAGRNP